MRIRTLIVDDEPLARAGLRSLLTSDPDMEIVAESNNGADAARRLQDDPVDLVFMDVQMPEMTGIEALSQIPSAQLPVVVFVTAFDHYALEAFRLHAVDYLLKPFTDEQFHETLMRAKEQVTGRRLRGMTGNLLALLQSYGPASAAVEHPAPEKAGAYIARIPVQTGSHVTFVQVDQIDWIEAADYYVQLHVGSKIHLLRETMNRLEKRLDPAQFVRIHRSTIVRLDRIQEIEKYFNGEQVVILRQGTKLKVSKNRHTRLKQLLTKPS